MSILIAGATIVSGESEKPTEGHSIWIQGSKIAAIGRRDEFDVPPATRIIDARDKYVIPGLMNANVHLLCDVRLENLARYDGRYEELIAEAAQVALKNGITTVFDTWGPRRFLMAVRDRISSGETVGARIFCAGNIIGWDGPFSPDNSKHPILATAAFARKINAIWVENTGRHLMWLTPQQIAKEIRAYIGKGIDFIKYGSNEHFPGAFLCFSSQAQSAIVDTAHDAGLTAQAHTTSVEGLRLAVEAGCDLIQHANVTGPTTIPETTLEGMAKRKTGAVIFPFTQKAFDWIIKNVSEAERTMWAASDTNAENLIRSGAPLLMANDGAIFAAELMADPEFFGKSWAGLPEEDGLAPLGTGHFAWFRAMEQKGCPPMNMLRAATRNIAVAYGKDKELGTIEPGKIADMIILDKNPLEAAANYRSIHAIIKDGLLVDREALPINPILTKAMGPPAEEEASFIPFMVAEGSKFPFCPTCMGH